ncbi:hypothetical protein ACFOON_03935 [Novosphingobium piscinae]|uniref:Secreted protein n=1 Tax=Novosphingobium piscinae TaxID=1507448 RepID=A0A7X1G076_9SPHN|nr:hypothetical protein [Novosphingobium piscinae]MBC2670234.1 hypothetical protein [Novosphingobium piscinae]
MNRSCPLRAGVAASRRWLLAASLVLPGACGEAPERTAPAGPPSTTAAALVVPGPVAAAALPRAPSAERIAAGLPALAGLRFGAPIPAGSSWQATAEPGDGQPADGCTIYRSAQVPDSYAIVIAGRLERVTFGPGSGQRLPGGVGPGSSATAVRAAYPQLEAEPHKYDAPPAGTLTSPDDGTMTPGLRFEIDGQRRVALIHLGRPPALWLVEGCA